MVTFITTIQKQEVKGVFVEKLLSVSSYSIALIWISGTREPVYHMILLLIPPKGGHFVPQSLSSSWSWFNKSY